MGQINVKGEDSELRLASYMRKYEGEVYVREYLFHVEEVSNIYSKTYNEEEKTFFSI